MKVCIRIYRVHQSNLSFSTLELYEARQVALGHPVLPSDNYPMMQRAKIDFQRFGAKVKSKTKVFYALNIFPKIVVGFLFAW